MAAHTSRLVRAPPTEYTASHLEKTLLALLGSVARAANGEHRLRPALSATLRSVCVQMGWPVGHAWRRDGDEGALVSSGEWYLDRADEYGVLKGATSVARLCAGDGLPGRILAGGVGTSTTVLTSDPRGDALAGFAGTVAMPVTCEGRVEGVLEFFTRTPPPTDPDFLDTLGQIAVLLAPRFVLERARAHTAFLQRVIEVIGHPVFVKDREFRFVLLNRALSDLVGHAPVEMLGKTDYDFFPPSQADFFRQKDVEMFARVESVVIEEEPLTDASGELHVLATTKVPLLDDTGQPTHLIGIIHDITRLKRAEQALHDTNDELARLVREKTAAMAQLEYANAELEAFSYSVSHDLRAPLRRIDGFAQLLLEGSADRLDAEGRDYLGRVLVNAQHLARIIDDLLGLSRVGRVEMNRTCVDLSDLAADVVADLRQADPGRNADVAIAPGVVTEGDLNLLKILLANLLGNAWKFTTTRAPARIAFGSTEEAGQAVYFVRDNGVGFEMREADKLFRPFSRLHTASTFPGTGIGLATVQRIVLRHGGRVAAVGDFGRGATVRFTLSPGEARLDTPHSETDAAP